jgi:hypothetical protein
MKLQLKDTTAMTTIEDRNTTAAAVTRAFFRLAGERVKKEVLATIAKHYGTTPEEIWDEVTEDGAEDLLDYIPAGGVRTAAHFLMQRHGLR